MNNLSSTILMCAILLLFYATGTVKGVAFGVACSSNDECDDDNNVCSTNCVCSSESFRNQAGNACVDKVVLEAVCADGEPATQCVDSLAECKDATGFKCLCKDNNYKSSTGCKAQVPVNDTCISTETSTEQCSKDNSECSSDGASGHKCFCTSAYYDASGTCTLRTKPNIACTVYQCVANAMCSTSDNKCACNTGYIATPTSTPTSCAIVAFDDTCTTDSDCGEDNNVCTTSKCKCSGTSFRNAANNACVTRIAPEATCTSGEAANQCVDNAECTAALKCVCTTNYYKSGTACKDKIDIGETCDKVDTATDQCSVTNTACNTGTSKCNCTSAYYELSSTCHDRKKPAEDCLVNQCVANAMCSSTKCACKTGYIAKPTTNPTSCESSDAATIMLAHMHVFIFGTVASLYFLV